MKVVATTKTVEAMKAELRRILPKAKSSHRAEALARGLGWATNAAMRAELANGATERILDPAAFKTFFHVRGLSNPGRAFLDAVLRTQIRAVMSAQVQLTHHGLGIFQRGVLSPADRLAHYTEQREQMLGAPALEEFERACEFLVGLDRTSAPTRTFSSYNLKHFAERWHQHRGIEGRWNREYVSNGMLLAAAYHLGFEVKRASRNAFTAYLNVSTVSVRALDEMRKPPLPQPGAGEPFLVLGTAYSSAPSNVHNCYVRAGDTKVTRLRPAEHTQKNLLWLATADYWISRFPPADQKSSFDKWAAIEELFGLSAKAGMIDLDRYRSPGNMRPT
jgi:hypothetical protein